jgi:alpha-L-fucosidase
MDLLRFFMRIFKKEKYPLEEVRKKEAEYREWLKSHDLPLPSNMQIEWLNDEIGMFCHFGINTFNNKEWSDGTLPASSFNPKNLDCEQWVMAAKGLGAKYMVITAKHHDGFCLWQTETTEYSVRCSPWKDGKGDVITEFVNACRKHNMKFGFYLSPWDRNQQKFGCYLDEEAYDEFYGKQLTELLKDHAEQDEVFELWFDGAGSAGHKYNWEKIIGVCKKYQPNALIFNMGAPTIRWVGNEDGLASEANWNVMQVGDNLLDLNVADIDNIGMKLEECYGLGNVWMPPECDTTIRKTKAGAKHWFYHTDDEKNLLPLKRLVEIYEKSVGRGANLLLNLSPDREGLIPQCDVDRSKELGDLVKKRYSSPIKTIRGTGKIIEMDTDSSIMFNCAMYQEDISKGQRVREYTLEYLAGSEWKELHSAYSIGHKKIDNFKPIKTSKLRLNITNTLDEPIIQTFSIFKI